MKKVAFQILINNIDKTSILKNYLLSINIENSFNQELKPGQIVLEFSSNLTYTWLFTDTVRILVWWEDEPASKFDSGVYYIDKLDDSLSSANQTYIIGASQQYLKFNIELGRIFYNKNIYYFTTMMSSILGNDVLNLQNYTIPTFGGNASSLSINTLKMDDTGVEVSNTFTSPFDVIIQFCKELGCVANLSDQKFIMYQIEQLAQLPLSFQNNSNRTVLSLNTNLQTNLVSKYYEGYYWLNRINFNSNYLTTTAQNFKKTYINDQFNTMAVNLLSLNRKNVGAYYQQLIEATTIDIDFIGNPKLATGIKFGLGVNYGRYSKEYFALRVVQKITEASWISTVEALPVNLLLPNNLQIESLFDINDNNQPPPIQPIYSIAIGKFYNAVGYDSPAKRLSFFTVESVLYWVRLNSIFGAFTRRYTDTEINAILTVLINECVTNNIRQDIAVMYALISSQGFSRPNTANNNVFRMTNQSRTIENSFSTLVNAASGLCQRLTRVGTTRGYVGTPMDTQVSTWTQNGHPSINTVNVLSDDYITVNEMRSYLVQMYIEMDIAQYASVDV